MKVGALMVALGGLAASVHSPPALPCLPHPGLTLDEDAYCEAPRTQGFAEPAPGRREVACESGLRGLVFFDDGFYQQAREALLRSLAAWDLPYGHLLMAKVAANLGRPHEAVEHVWLAARHGGRGLTVEELELLAQLERHLLDHELGDLGADASALVSQRIGVAVNVTALAREARRLEQERTKALDAARRESAWSKACAGLKGEDKTLCSSLEAERWRMAERLREVETRSRQIVDRLLEHRR